MPSPLGALHIASALAAIVAGAVVLWFEPKGGRRHRLLGWTYVSAMLVLNGTALLIYKLFGGFGPFHVAALLSLVTVIAGTAAARSARRSRLTHHRHRRAVWVETHYWWMTFSYVGLIAALASELITRLPVTRAATGGPGALFGWAVAVATAVIVGGGAYFVRSRAARALTPFRATRD